jgi:GNAT superfamily N-acetyltransferase
MNNTSTLPSPRAAAATPGHNEIELIRPDAQHIPELARICYEAFGDLHDRHRVPRDFHTLEFARMVIGLFVSRPEIHAVAARVDDALAGSNYLSLLDEASGIGPISVDPAQQGKRVGRVLMQAVMDEAERRGIRQVRLVQEALNTTSASLYASLGFEVREPLALMKLSPTAAGDFTVRAFHPGDFPALDDLCRRHCKVSRLNELKFWTSLDMPLFVREREGRLRGYFLPGKLGHSVAETTADALALFSQAGRVVPVDSALILCPMRHSELFQGALRAGHRVVKVLTLMTRGPYPEPDGAWTASYLY